MSHHEDAFSIPLWQDITAQIITSVESPEINKPQVILSGVEGSLLRFLRNAKKPTTNGVRTTTQKGLMD